MTAYVSHAAAFRAQADFSADSKIKVGSNIWSEGTAGERLYEKVLSKNPATVGKVIALASELKELPFTSKQVQGHLRWIFTAGQLEVDGKSYVVKAKPTKEPKAAKVKVAKPEAKVETKPEAKAKAKAETKAAAMRKRSFVKIKKLAKAA
jgi:hypothetical protein